MATGAGRWALLASVLGSGVAFLDSSVVNVALEAIGEDFDAGFNAFQWVVTAYLVTLGALVLLGGSLGDLFGKRLMFVVGLSWFAVASIAAGVAPNIGSLIAARAVQGIGAALLIPSSLAMVQVCFVPDDRGQAVGAWTGLSGMSVIIGPFLGGWLVDAFTWRLVFLINPPLAAFAIWVALRYIPEHRLRREAPRPDTVGAALVSLGLGSLVFALIQGPEQGWGNELVVVLGLLGALALVAFLVVETRVPNPMLPLKIFRSRQFSGVNMTTLPVYFALSGFFFLLTLELLLVLDYSALAAGAASAPILVLLALLSPRAGKLAPRPRWPMTIGPLVAAVGVALASRVGPGSSYWSDVLPPVILFGLGLSLTVAPLTTTALNAVDEAHTTLASGINNAVARIAGLLAIPLLPLAAGLGGVADITGLEFSDGFSRAMWIGAAILALGGLVSWLTIRDLVPEPEAIE